MPDIPRFPDDDELRKRARRSIDQQRSDPTEQLVNALSVFLLDRRIRRFLDTTDPKSLDQAFAALQAAGVDTQDPKWIFA